MTSLSVLIWKPHRTLALIFSSTLEGVSHWMLMFLHAILATWLWLSEYAVLTCILHLLLCARWSQGLLYTAYTWDSVLCDRPQPLLRFYSVLVLSWLLPLCYPSDLSISATPSICASFSSTLHFFCLAHSLTFPDICCCTLYGGHIVAGKGLLAPW